MRRVTIACSSRSLSERSSCSPRWSSTAGSALRRVEPASASVPGAQAVAAHEQLGAGGDERALPAPGAEGEARREGLAQDAEHRRRVVRARRVDLHLAREDDLVQRPGADALDRPRHRGLVVLGRHRADHAVAPGRVGVEQRQRRAAQRAPRARRSRAASASASSSGAATAASVSVTCSPRRASATSGTCSDAGSKPAQCGVEPPSGAKAKPPTATGPPVLARRVGQQLAPARGDAPEAPRRRGRRARRRDRRWPARSGRDRGARSRTSPRPGRREATATAVGSTVGASATVIATRHSPERRARRTPSPARARRSSRSPSPSSGRPAACRSAVGMPAV